MKSFSHNRPDTFQKVGDGSHYYNYGITEAQQPEIDPQEEGASLPPVFEYESVRIFGELTRDNITKAVLRERRDEAEEMDLVNRYNSYVLGISDNQTDLADYQAYLQEIIQTKTMVQTDIDAYHAAGE